MASGSRFVHATCLDRLDIPPTHIWMEAVAAGVGILTFGSLGFVHEHKRLISISRLWWRSPDY